MCMQPQTKAMWLHSKQNHRSHVPKTSPPTPPPLPLRVTLHPLVSVLLVTMSPGPALHRTPAGEPPPRRSPVGKKSSQDKERGTLPSRLGTAQQALPPLWAEPTGGVGGKSTQKPLARTTTISQSPEPTRVQRGSCQGHPHLGSASRTCQAATSMTKPRTGVWARLLSRAATRMTQAMLGLRER